VVGSCEHSDEPLGSILENHGFYSMLGFYGLKRLFNVCLVGSHSSSVVGLGWMAGVQFLVGARVGFFFLFSLWHCIQTGSGAHPASVLWLLGLLLQ
jgi:hypothetical protein